MKEKEKIVSEIFTDAEREQLEIVSVELPKDKFKNRIVLYVSSAVLIFIGIGAMLLWNAPKYSSSSDLLKLNNVYVMLQDLEKELLAFEDGNNNFSQARLQNNVITMQEAVHDLPPGYEQFQQEWNSLKEILLNQLPSEDLVNRLSDLEDRVNKEISSFINLLEGFSSELTQKRNFSLETIRTIDLVVANAYKIDASIVRILSETSKNNVRALSQLSEHINLLQKGLSELREGNSELGIQSLVGALEEETLNEAQFIYASLSKELGEFVSNAPELITLKQVQQKLLSQDRKLGESLQNAMVSSFKHDRKAANKIGISNTILIVILCLSLLLFFVIFLLLRRRITVLHFETLSEREVNEKHENAILKLVDELEGLGAGDLGVELTVTDDSTGVIADSINVAIEKLRYLIEKVKKSQSQILNQVVQNNTVLEKGTSFQDWFLAEKESLQKKLDDISAKASVIKKYFNQMTKDEGVLFQLIDSKEEVALSEKTETIKKIFQMLSKVIIEIEDDVAKLTSTSTFINNETEGFISIVDELKGKNLLFTEYVSELDETISQFKVPEKSADFKID